MRFYLVYVTDQIPFLFQILCSPMYLFLIVYFTYIENKYLNSLINSWYVSYAKRMRTEKMNRWNNEQKKRDKTTSNDIQTATQKTKD